MPVDASAPGPLIGQTVSFFDVEMLSGEEHCRQRDWITKEEADQCTVSLEPGFGDKPRFDEYCLPADMELQKKIPALPSLRGGTETHPQIPVWQSLGKNIQKLSDLGV